MRIDLVGPIPPPITGHAGANASLVVGLELLGHRVRVFNTTGRAVVEDVAHQGRFKAGKAWRAFVDMLAILRSVSTGQPDVVYLTPGQTLLGFLRFGPLVFVATLMRLPVVAHFHGGYFRTMYDGLGGLGRLLVRWQLGMLRRVVVLGPSLRAMFDGLVAAERIVVCENGVEAKLALSSDELDRKVARRNLPGPRRILFLSNLLPTKGILDLLGAAKILVSEGVAFHLYVAGAYDESVRREVEGGLAELGGFATYLGIVTGQTKRDTLVAADVLCLPTYFPVEGQPICLLEAYATGCTVVTTDQGGIRDIFVSGRDGAQCKARDARSIAAALREAMSMSSAVARSNHERALRNYTQEAFVARVEAILMLVSMPSGR